MKLEDAVEIALEGHAILFAGSGFSYGATNLDGNAFKTGKQLAASVFDKCGISDHGDYGLDVAATVFTSQFSEQALIEFIFHEYSLGDVAKHHEDILSISWKRIYTTNYDRVIEEAAARSRTVLTPVTLSDIMNGNADICVHINGFIDRLNTTTLNNEFKLTDKSYSSEELVGKPWFEFMKNDFRSAKAIFVVGYSMLSDIDIKRLLAAPVIREKVIIITKPEPEQIEKKLLSSYGELYCIGVNGLAENIARAKDTFVDSVGAPEYICFSHEYREPLKYEEPTYEDISNLYHIGSFNDSLLERTKNSGFVGDYKYIISRSVISTIVRDIRKFNVFLITSDLGNGKTIICELLRNEFRTEDIHVFILRRRLIEIDKEIQSIASINDKHCVVFFDNYYNYHDELKAFSYYQKKNITFILTARNVLNNLNFRKLQHSLNISADKVRLIPINKLDTNEVRNLAYVFRSNSILSPKMQTTRANEIESHITNKCKSKFSDILLEFFDSSDIRGRLENLYKDILCEEKKEVKELAIFALMRATMNINIDFEEALTLLDINFALLSARDEVFINEIFDVQQNDFIVKSSVVARELLYSIIDFSDLSSVMSKMIKSADETYKINKQYKDLLANLVSHTHFAKYQNSENADSIKGFYNSIRNTSFCKQNPFFLGAICFCLYRLKELLSCITVYRNGLFLCYER